MAVEGQDSDFVDRAARFAVSLRRVFGDRAKALADEQAASAIGTTALSWARIRDALRVLEEADAHMQHALALLDSVGELTASIHLDHAISVLGMRRTSGAAGLSGVIAGDPG